MNRVLLRYTDGHTKILNNVQMIYLDGHFLKIVFSDRVEQCDVFKVDTFKVY